ncbi:hypothetical protein KVG88_30000 [Pseudomonas sp. SWRI74]|uniref:Uncharacterized protein n=1 Tax=Pseudomonas azerbaijanoccidentalis TaxID=2842347 RepID=A0ABS6QZI7_9PSED|nr:hypothetical protein [Pseudomonas azerbaijanoccidentalis]MBV4524308.1 hypothetical protein [Pseudomonas azerbaijanoccidentalis]
MAKIKVKQGAGDEPSVLATAICAGQTFPFMATISHKAVKPLLVPSTGMRDVIAPGEEVQFKVKSFEQAWVLVTDSAALAKRYESNAEDFVVIEVPDVVKEEPTPEVPEEAPKVVETKPTGKGGKAAADAASE